MTYPGHRKIPTMPPPESTQSSLSRSRSRSLPPGTWAVTQPLAAACACFNNSSCVTLQRSCAPGRSRKIACSKSSVSGARTTITCRFIPLTISYSASFSFGETLKKALPVFPEFIQGSPEPIDKRIRREILAQGKVWKRRNTLCISSFQTAALVQKIRRSPQAIGSEFPLSKRIVLIDPVLHRNDGERLFRVAHDDARNTGVDDHAPAHRAGRRVVENFAGQSVVAHEVNIRADALVSRSRNDRIGLGMDAAAKLLPASARARTGRDRSSFCGLWARRCSRWRQFRRCGQ